MEPHEFGPYLLVEQIAVGGMAQIYLAKIRGIAGFEKFLALKLLHPTYASDEQFIEMLIEEAKIAVRLNHVNIAQVFDLGRVDERYFIAMEFVDGADLFKVMRRLTERDIDVPIDVATFIVQELCTGLDYAHRQTDVDGKPLDIIHRDISPQNILISQAGEVKIVDFGIAKATSRAVATQAGVIKGKYFYMSPEQAWGDTVDQRSDIFSAGIILYEVLTGQMLYLEEDMQRLLEMVRKADIAPPTTRRPGIPRELEKIVMKALAKKPKDRWQNANEFQEALTNFLFSYASDFTPDRVSNLVARAMDDEDEAEPEELSLSDVLLEETESEDLGTAEPRDVSIQTQQLSVADLMSRDDFRAEEESSVIFRLDELDGEVEEDLGEPTVVSGPPQVLAAIAGAARVDVDSDEASTTESDAWEEQAGTPTTVTRQADLPDAIKVDEVVVPAAAQSKSQTLVKPDGIAPSQPPPKPPPLPVAPDRDSPTKPQWLPSQQSPGWVPNVTQPRSLQQVLDPVPQTPAPQLLTPTPAPPAPLPQTKAPQPPPPPIPASFPSPTSPPASSTAAPQAGADWPTGPQPLADKSGADWPTGPQPLADKLATDWSNATLDGSLPGGAATWPAEKKKRRLARFIIVASVIAICGAGAVLALTLWPEEKPAVIDVMSVPSRAEVWLDGAKVPGVTRMSITVKDPKRSHTLQVKTANYQPSSPKKVTFPKGQRRKEVLIILQPLYGRLEVESKPSGAEVYLNSEHKGSTPITIEGLSLSEEINLELRKRGFRPETRTIGWEGRLFRKASISLKRSR